MQDKQEVTSLARGAAATRSGYLSLHRTISTKLYAPETGLPSIVIESRTPST